MSYREEGCVFTVKEMESPYGCYLMIEPSREELPEFKDKLVMLNLFGNAKKDICVAKEVARFLNENIDSIAIQDLP